MKNIEINKPCSENWNEMSKNEQGAFCQKCATQVHDFTKKSSSEIKQTLLELVGKPVCGRITNKQEIELNTEFNLWMNRQNHQSFQSQLLFALLIVFGLGLFSCENPKDEKNLKDMQTSIARIIEEEESQIPAESEKSQTQQPIIFMESVISGMMEMEEVPQIIEPIMKDEPTVCFKKEENYYTHGGAIVMTERYVNYLTEEVNQTNDEVDENGNTISKKFEAKVFPNPAKEQTTFEIAIPEKGLFEISLYDINGKMLKVIRNGELNKGKFRQELDLIDLVPGMYLIIINSGNFKETVRFSKI